MTWIVRDMQKTRSEKIQRPPSSFSLKITNRIHFDRPMHHHVFGINFLLHSWSLILLTLLHTLLIQLMSVHLLIFRAYTDVLGDRKSVHRAWTFGNPCTKFWRFIMIAATLERIIVLLLSLMQTAVIKRCQNHLFSIYQSVLWPKICQKCIGGGSRCGSSLVG